MRFRKQLIAGVVGLVMVTSLVGTFALVTMHMSTDRTVGVTRDVIEEMQAVQRVRVSAEQVVARARAYLLTGADSERARLVESERELTRTIETLRYGETDPATAVHLFALEQRLLDYSRATAAAARARKETDSLQYLVWTFESMLQPRRDALDVAVDRFAEGERLKLELEARRAASSLGTLSLALAAAFALAIGASIVLAIVMVRRVSDQYRRVRDAEAAAERAARARKEIVDIVAHDLLSPLHAIGLGLEVIEYRHGHIAQLATIKDAAERMNRLIRDLHDVSRAEQMKLALEVRAWSIRDLLAAALVPFEQRAQRANVELRLVAPDGLTAQLDGARVQQVLSNLIGNALRVSPAGSTITVSAERDGSAIRFAVTDGGPGIPPEDLAGLFGAYKQGHRSRGSLGLGLYICKSLVTAHGGQIGAQSEPGRGATFWFEIPQPS